jgi:anti-anti-sigma regulatory factor
MKHKISMPEYKFLTRREGDDPEPLSSHSIPQDVEFFEIQGLFSLGAFYKFNEISRVTSKKPKVMIVGFRKVPFLDSEGSFHLKNFRKICDQRGVGLIFSSVNPSIKRTLMENGFSDMVHEDRVFSSLGEAIKKTGDYLRQE